MKYLHDTNISSVRVGREETWWGEDLCCKSLQRSLTKVHLSVVVLDGTIQKLLGLLELKLSLVLSSNIRLFKDLLVRENNQMPEQFRCYVCTNFVSS